MSDGHVRLAYRGSTASWLEPESNHTSRMSASRSNVVDPHDGHVRPAGTNSSRERSYHASAPYSSNTDAARSTIDVVKMASPHFAQSSAGIGTPQARWREMHQSGLFSTMFWMRSRPQVGIQLT